MLGHGGGRAFSAALVDLLLRQGCRVAATLVADDRRRNLAGVVERFPCDVRDAGALARVLAEVRPGVIFHLAGLARGDDLGELSRSMCWGPTARRSQPMARPRYLIPGSAAEYGLLATADPVDETTPLSP